MIKNLGYLRTPLHECNPLLQLVMWKKGGKTKIYKKDGAWPHTLKELMVMLRGFFDDRFVSTGRYPPPHHHHHHSPNLSPLDYFLWGYLKDKIFETAVPNENVLHQRITEEIQRILPHTLRMVFRNLWWWAFMCKNVLGTQFQHLL